MDRGSEPENSADTEAGTELAGTMSTQGGSSAHDYGGLDQNLDQVDLDAASEVGADPPGPLGLDIGGGAGNIGQRDEVSE